jgi:hypothetical protein
MKLKLGVLDAKDLLDSTSCLKVGRHATLVDAGLSFSEYYMRPEVAKKGVQSKEIEHVSAGVFSSARAAKLLSGLLPPDARAEAEQYEKRALTFNKSIREKWLGEKAPQPTEKEVASMRRSIASLRTMADKLSKQADYLCTTGTPKPKAGAAPRAPKLPPLSGTFVYPRYKPFGK